MTEVVILGISVREYLNLKEGQGYPVAKGVVEKCGLDALKWEASVIDWVVSQGNWQHGITREDLEKIGWFDDHGGFGDEAMIITLRPTDQYVLNPDSVKILE